MTLRKLWRAGLRGTGVTVVLAAMLVPPGLGFAQDNVRLPDMHSSGRVLAPEDERNFPLEFERYMRANGLLVEDPIVQSFFIDMGYRLVSHSDRSSQDFHFHVLKVPGINAFAAPAGVIGLNAGLILAAKNEHEVAGVVAHEIAHVTQNHLARSMEEAQRVSVPMMLATLGIILAGSAAGAMTGDAIQGIMLGGMGLAQQTQINYTRQNEAEADRIGINLMARAGYDPNGMVDFFQTLNLATRAQGAGPPEYLRSHPLTVGRIAEARDRAERLEPRRPVESGLFHYAQARLRILMESQPDTAVDYFDAQLGRDRMPEAAARYGKALGLIRARRLDEAENELEWLLSEDPENQYYRLLKPELRTAQNRHPEALELLAELHRGYGKSRLVAVSYVKALLHEASEERAALATSILREQLHSHPGDVLLTELMARSANQAGDPVRAAEAVAENYYLRGGLPQAVEQLERLMRRDDLDYYQRARVSARLDELRVELERTNRGRRSG